jgi:16S rRNA (guanine527-N7)-methyltransferase
VTGRYQQLCDAAGPVSRETYERLLDFEATFRRWAEQLNLVASSQLASVWERHILDSAQLLPHIPHDSVVLDIGSGGGFPGIVLGLLAPERGRMTVNMVESNRKKAGFLQAMIGQYALPAKVHAVRIEDAVGRVPEPRIVTARALAPLPLLLQLASPWLTKGATALFHKGRDYRHELQESINDWSFDLVEHPSRIDPESVILEIHALRKKPV